MNRIVRILFFIFLLFSISWTQSLPDFGIKMGILSSKYEYKIIGVGSNSFFNDTRIGPTMGLFLRYLDKKHFNIESEIIYLQKGGEEEIEITTVDNPDGTGKFIIHDIHFDYMQFLTNIRPKTKLHDFGFYGLAGFSINYLLQVRNAFRNVDDFNRIIFAYSLGAGIEFYNIINKPIFIEFIVNNDMSEVYDEADFKFKSYLFRVGFNI